LSTLTNSPPRSPHRRHRVIWLLIMGTIGASVLVGSLLGMCVARAAPPAVSVINDDWRVWGDAQARPVQAFDDGRALYLQLRNPAEPPAVMGPNGPLAYSMHGPYMVLPILPYMHLQYGPYQATVQSTGSAEGMPGVVSVTSPVEVPHTLPVAVPPVTVQPVVPPASLYGNITTGAPNTVFGQIVATNTSTGASTSTRLNAGNLRSGGNTFTYVDARAASTWEARRNQQWVIRADGTAAGAKAALDSQASCTSAKATCTIEYRGAPAGTLVISEKNV